MPAPIARETAVRGANNVAGPTVTLTTAQTDYILLLAAYNENTGSAARTVTSVTSAGLTWALRRRSNASTTGGLEVWWAHGTGALSSYVITVNFSGTYDICGLGVMVVTGCASPTAPFDPNVSMPTAQSAPSAALWLPTFTGINTSSANDLLLFVTGSISGGGTPPTRIFPDRIPEQWCRRLGRKCDHQYPRRYRATDWRDVRHTSGRRLAEPFRSTERRRGDI